LRQAEQLAPLEERLSALLQGKERPKDAAEGLLLAQFCLQSHRQGSAARFFGEAFAAQPALAADPRTGRRYDAACAAALAGCGHGKDNPPVADLERARLRRQSLDWLRADLGAWQQILAKDPAQARDTVAKVMTHWLGDTDLAGVRGTEALARLPEAEWPRWQQLWQDVQALRDRATKAP
jgi:hypothetical protein